MKRAQGRPGAGWHPRSVRRRRTRCGPQVQPRSPGLPCANGFNGFLRDLPGETSSIATVAARIVVAQTRSGRNASARLDASVGRQDHTTSPSAHVFARAFDGWRVLTLEAKRRRCQRRFVPREAAAHDPSEEGRPATSLAPGAVASTASRPAFRDDRDTPLVSGRMESHIRRFRNYEKQNIFSAEA